MSSVPLPVTAAAAAVAALGMALIVTRPQSGSLRTTRRRERVPVAQRFSRWIDQAGIGDVSPSEFVAATATIAVCAGAAAFAMFGGLLPPLGVTAAAATMPLASYRRRRLHRLQVADEAWPAMIEEIRIRCGSAGRSIPQALFDVGLRGPDELRDAFATAQRNWLLTTDFASTIDLLKAQLGSSTADAACETLLVAHQLGGHDLDRRLAELAEDRRQDTLERKDARSKQAGVRFARMFVVVVPLGMALAGMSLGNGRAAYSTPTGQFLVSVGLILMALCWVWSGRILRLPTEERVFS